MSGFDEVLLNYQRHDLGRKAEKLGLLLESISLNQSNSEVLSHVDFLESSMKLYALPERFHARLESARTDSKSGDERSIVEKWTSFCMNEGALIAPFDWFDVAQKYAHSLRAEQRESERGSDRAGSVLGWMEALDQDESSGNDMLDLQYDRSTEQYSERFAASYKSRTNGTKVLRGAAMVNTRELDDAVKRGDGDPFQVISQIVGDATSRCAANPAADAEKFAKCAAIFLHASQKIGQIEKEDWIPDSTRGLDDSERAELTTRIDSFWGNSMQSLLVKAFARLQIDSEPPIIILPQVYSELTGSAGAFQLA